MLCERLLIDSKGTKHYLLYITFFENQDRELAKTLYRSDLVRKEFWATTFYTNFLLVLMDKKVVIQYNLNMLLFYIFIYEMQVDTYIKRLHDEIRLRNFSSRIEMLDSLYSMFYEMLLHITSFSCFFFIS